MVRVLHSVHGMNRGGIETFIMNVYRCIDRSKVQFDFLVHTQNKCDYDDEINALGGRIYYVPSRREGLLESIKKTNEFFREHQEYKIIHVHRSSLSDITVLREAKKNGIPCRIIHGHSTKQWGSSLHKFLHRYHQMFIRSLATHYFACSLSVAEWMYPKWLYHNHEFKIIKNGIDPKKFVFNKKIRENKRNEIGIADKFVIGHVGRFHPAKNHEFLIDIFYYIQNIKPNAILLLIGDGLLRERIEEKAIKLGIIDKIIFTGVRSDTHELYQAMDIFVMPSYYEGFPVTLVEAQASGLKCVVSSTITKETKITDLISFLNLSDGPRAWSNYIIKSANYSRENKYSMILEAGFDIQSVASTLQTFYTEISAKC